MVKENPSVQVVKDSPAAITSSGSEIERLKQDWKQILDSAPIELKRTNAVALLRSSKPLDIQGDRITLSFRYSIHKDNIEKPENMKIAEKLVSDYLGRPCHVACVFRPEENRLVQAAIEMGAKVVNVEDK